MLVFFKVNLSVLAIKEINRWFDFQAGFANKLWRVCITTKRRRVPASTPVGVHIHKAV
jgi:hypothetical protein